jgi:hypothetical protein
MQTSELDWLKNEDCRTKKLFTASKGMKQKRIELKQPHVKNRDTLLKLYRMVQHREHIGHSSNTISLFVKGFHFEYLK